MKRALRIALACGFALAACKSDDKPTGPVVDIGNQDAGSSGVSDAANGNDDDDGGNVDVVDAGTPEFELFECDKLDPVRAANEELPITMRPSGVTLPMDFVATREIATWTGGCDHPELLIMLSDGVCSRGKGHEIRFYISVEAATSGKLGVGENSLLGEPKTNGIRVRYTRPDSLDPHGLWGSCKDSSGVFTLPTDFDFTKHDNITARFQLTLSHCDAPIEADGSVLSSDAGVDAGTSDDDLAPIEINGAFNAQLHRTLSQYCPETTK